MTQTHIQNIKPDIPADGTYEATWAGHTVRWRVGDVFYTGRSVPDGVRGIAVPSIVTVAGDSIAVRAKDDGAGND